jgi:hypothetical protein
MLELGSLVAYRDRETHLGSLRDEWRVRLVTDFDPADLADAWGLDWRRYSPFAGFVLEHRYIRRGTTEPWTPFQSTNEYEQVLGYIDDKAIVLCPTLGKLRDAQRLAAEEERRVAEETARLAEEARVAREKREASQAAFRRMYNSPKYTQWAGAWNGFNQRHTEDADRIRADEEVMCAYNAVLAATTVPSKVSAIKEFLKIAKTIGLE